MKKLCTAALLSLVAVAGFAQDYDENKPVAYYPAPDGVFFLGVDMKGEQPGSDIALAPTGVNLTFKAKLEEDFYGDYAWMASEYGVDELDNENLVIMRGASDELVEAPTLYVVDGRGYNTYAMTRGGIAFGYGFLADRTGNEYYAANYNQAELNGLFFDKKLFLNWDEATATLNAHFAEEGLRYKDVKVRGWAEYFSYAKDYLLRAIHAGVVTDGKLAKGDVVAKVFAYDADGKVGTEPVATFVSDSVKLHETGPNFYEVNLVADQPLLVKSPIMVVITNAEGCEKKFGPEELRTQTNHVGENVTSYLWADYTFGSTQNTGKYLQWSNEAYDYGRTYYLKHWNVSIKQDYDTSTGIDDLTIAKQPTASAKKGFYSLTGVKLSDGNDLSNLPKGIYVVDGKKVMKR